MQVFINIPNSMSFYTQLFFKVTFKRCDVCVYDWSQGFFVLFFLGGGGVNFVIHHEYGYWHILLRLVFVLVKLQCLYRILVSSEYSAEP